MRKRIAVTAILLVLSLTSCKCVAEKAAVSRLEDQQEKVFAKYTAYVSADPKKTAAEKDDEQKLLQSLRDIILALKRSMGE